MTQTQLILSGFLGGASLGAIAVWFHLGWVKEDLRVRTMCFAGVLRGLEGVLRTGDAADIRGLLKYSQDLLNWFDPRGEQSKRVEHFSSKSI